MADFTLIVPPVRPNGIGRAAVQTRTSPSGTDALPNGRYRLHRRSELVALCLGSLMIGTVALADERQSDQRQGGVAVQSDQGIESQLRQIEHQIIIGHTMAPDGDNALDTWRHLLEVISPASPDSQKKLADFAKYTRQRSTEEQAAGRWVVSIDLLVFADQVMELLQHQGPYSASALVDVPPPITAPAVPDEPPPALPPYATTRDMRPPGPPNDSAPTAMPAEPKGPGISQAQVPAGGLASSGGSVPLAALTREPVAPARAPGNTNAAPSGVLAHPGVTPRTSQEQSAAAALASRGDAKLAIKDVSAARAFYEYAANAGSARAAMALAETYDPAFLDRMGAIGPKPDPAMAARWYREAAALGERAAEVRLRTLGTEAAN